MRLCTQCECLYLSHLNSCPQCKHSPQRISGIEAHAPHLAHQGGGFKAEYFEHLAKLEEKNFWFIARNELINWAIEKYHNNFDSFLEIGCGTGYVLSGIASNYPGRKLFGSEIFINGLDYATQRTPSATLFQMDARNIPFKEEYDIIGAFDVLEHIEEDVGVLEQIHDALAKSGTLILTVPQHSWLWSASDEHAHHVRRYSAKDLRSKLVNCGFNILHQTSFVSLLLPLMMASRLRNKQITENYDALEELRCPTVINQALLSIMRLEAFLIKRGLKLPAGGSLLVIAQKR